jgi:uncharacterized protein YyaL (SSP411 family)
LDRRVEIFDSVEPAGNSAMVTLLGRLSVATGNRQDERLSATALRTYSNIMRERGLEMAGWLDAALTMGGPTYDTVVCGDPRSVGTQALTAAWRGLLAPWVTGVASRCDEASGELEKAMPTVTGKRVQGGTPTAYVCTRGTCKLPTSKPETVRTDVMVGWLR